MFSSVFILLLLKWPVFIVGDKSYLLMAASVLVLCCAAVCSCLFHFPHCCSRVPKQESIGPDPDCFGVLTSQ